MFVFGYQHINFHYLVKYFKKFYVFYPLFFYICIHIKQKTTLKKITGTPFENVLLIDDEEIDNLINERLMQVAYFADKVHVRTSVPSALNFLYTVLNKGEGIPNVIFLDLHLPQHDGFHFLLEFKQMFLKYDELKNTRIVVLSAFINKYPDHLLDAHNFVMDKVNKPLREEVLEDLKRKHTLQALAS